MLAQNVQELRSNLLGEKLELFLNVKGSKNTVVSYRSDIKQFFQVVYGKDVEFATIEDVESISVEKVAKFLKVLKDSELKGATINRKLNAVKVFFNYLSIDNQKINTKVFMKDFKQNTATSKSHGTITLEEAQKVANVSKEIFEKEDGNQFSLLVKLAIVTSMRLNSLLTLNWENFYKKEENNKMINVIEVVDKSKKHRKAISNELFNELQSLALNEKLFQNLHTHKVGKMLKTALKVVGVEKNRNVTFHSLKAVGVNYVLDVTGDIKLAQKQGNHESELTTIKHYQRNNEKLSESPALTILNSENTIQKFEENLEDMSKEDLVAIIKQMSIAGKMEAMRIMEKI